MLERSESAAVIGTYEAAGIPVASRGRAYLRLGPRRLVPFQAAYGARPLRPGGEQQPIIVSDFDVDIDVAPDAANRGAVRSTVSSAPTELAAIVDAASTAADLRGLPAPRRPWRDALPDVVVLDAGDTRPGGGRYVVVGTIDVPEQQAQHPLVVDLEDGGCLVFGSAGSGKTTLLRTVAASACTTSTTEQLTILVLEGASIELGHLADLAHVVDVVSSADLEALTRHVVTLEREIERRRSHFAAVQADDLTAFNADHPPVARIVVLIDGLGSIMETLGECTTPIAAAGDSWPERLVRILIDGRRVGVHAVITSDRRGVIPARLLAAIPNRIVLRHAEPIAYAEHGIASTMSAGATLVPGRGWWRAATVMQICVVSADHSAPGQRQAIQRLGRSIARPPRVAVWSVPLPASVTVPHRLVSPGMVAIGVEDVSGELVLLDLDRSNMLVVGGARTGKSTALATIAIGMARDREVHVVTADAGGMVVPGATTMVGGDAAAVARLLDDLTARVRGCAAVPPCGRGRRSRPARRNVADRRVVAPCRRARAGARRLNGTGGDARLLGQPDRHRSASGALHVAAPARRPGRAGADRR